MSQYRAIIHYHFKRGMEEAGMKFFEKEMIERAPEYGCQGIELWQSKKDPAHAVGIAAWNSLEDARKFHRVWDSKEEEILGFCADTPYVEFFMTHPLEKQAKKAA